MSSSLRLSAATPDLRELLVGKLTEHGVACYTSGKVVVVNEGTGADRNEGETGPERIVALLRTLIPTPEREAISVVEEMSFPHEFPVTTRLEAWWSVFETSWFEKALAADGFSVWLQPVVDTTARRAIGHECLIHLTRGRPRRGAEIMATASNRRDLGEFDSYTRQLAIHAIVGETRKGRGADSIWFLNFIPSAMTGPEYRMREALELMLATGLRPRSFVMEAVESNRNPDLEHLRRIAVYLREHGIGFALDDVAVNSEGLRLVCELRPDYIKLERNLARRLAQKRDAASVRRFVDVSDRLGVRVVAKGVERLSTAEQLWGAGIRYMQGHLFGSPAPGISDSSADLARFAHAVAPSAQPDGACDDFVREETPLFV